MKTQAKTAIVLTILLLSLLGFMPTVTFEDNPQGSSGTISLNATGNATPIGNGKGNSKNATAASAALNLAGSVSSEGNGNQLKLWNLTGSLLISSTPYSLSKGQGEENSKGSLEIEAKTSNAGHSLELQLHGSIQGNNVVFSSNESKLASQYFLSLSGQETVSLTTSNSSSSNTSAECSSQSQGQNQDQSHGDEECSAESSTSNVTVTQTVTQTSNQTITQTIGNPTATQTVTVTQPGTTITVTQTSNRTVTETTTVSNATITVTTT